MIIRRSLLHQSPASAVAIVITTLAMLFSPVPWSVTAQAAPERSHPGNSAEALAQRADRDGAIRLVVEVDSTRNGPAVAAEGRRNRGVQIRTFDFLPYVALRGDGQTIRALQRNPHVVAISEDRLSAPTLDSTLPVINADDTQSLGWTGAGTTVAILDTGIDADHPFFNDNNGTPADSRILSQACYSTPSNNTDEFSLCPGEVTSSTAAGSADIDGNARCAGIGNRCDHGTHVAGIAAGDATGLTGASGNGVAPDAGIIAIQVFTRFNDATDCGTNPAPCLLTYESDQIAGLNRVAALNTANAGWNITAVNMSLGAGNNATACDGDNLKTTIDTLLGAGIATVIASGNNGFLNAVGAPGCISTAVTVGNSVDDDTVAGSSNRGPLLDLFAPGTNVTSSVVDDTWGGKSGTSMAAPHVAGAFSVLREAYPARTIAQLLGDMTSTGVPITYAIDTATPPATATTPRLNLLAALQAPNLPPTLTAGQPTVTVDEGTVATNTGAVSDPEANPITAMSASVGTVIRSGGTWSWSWQTADGPTQSQVVTISATDDKGEVGTVTFQLNVTNVAPTVALDPSQVTVIDEGDSVTVTATFSDPGWLDTHTAAIDWGVPVGQGGELIAGPKMTVTAPGGPGTPRRGTVTGSYRYGDNDAGFPITVSVTDKDGGVGSASVSLTVRNVAPSVAVDLGGSVLLNGVPTVVTHAGDDALFASAASDPGSDDLDLGWDFGDGSTSATLSLVNPPAPDTLPSPTVQPRDVNDNVTHAFTEACLYQVRFTATDDDGGTASEAVDVVITGNADLARSSGYWSAEYRAKKSSDFTPAALQCYLDIVNHVSAVFSEVRTLASSADAANVLKTARTSAANDLFDAQLLAAWLNFANGAYDLEELGDGDGDGVADTAFLDLLVAAETLRTDPTSTRADLLAMKNVLERLNNP